MQLSSSVGEYIVLTDFSYKTEIFAKLASFKNVSINVRDSSFEQRVFASTVNKTTKYHVSTADKLVEYSRKVMKIFFKGVP